MRLSRLRFGLLLSAMAAGSLSLPVAAAAQTPKGDVSFGYQFAHAEETNFPVGWYVDFAGNASKVVGIVGEIGGVYKSESESAFGVTADASIKVHTFMGGVRFSGRTIERVVPFGQFLVGAAALSASAEVDAPGFDFNASESTTEFALQFGGGVDLMVGKKAGVRIAMGYVRIFTEDEGINTFKFTVGAVFPFGAR